MLVFHGKNDELTSYSASKKLVENSGENIKFIGFNEAYHEIHNEPEKEELLSNIYNWIDSNF
jgi:alpha-beta hydrolase superfamily lysophospholipase